MIVLDSYLMSTLHSGAELVQLKFIAKLNTPQKDILERIKPDFWEIEAIDCVFGK